MSLSDCVKCWDTPCTCGYNYRAWSQERLEDFITMLQKVLTEKRRDETETDRAKEGIHDRKSDR